MQRAASGAAPLVASSPSRPSNADRPPTPAMKAYVVSLAKGRGLKPPRGYANSGAICRAFLDKHVRRKKGAGAEPAARGRSAPLTERQQASEAPLAPAPTARKTGKGKQRSPKIRVGKTAPPSPPASSAADATAGDTRLNIPYGNKETAQRLGARYRDGTWYGPAGLDLAEFRERGWL